MANTSAIGTAIDHRQFATRSGSLYRQSGNRAMRNRNARSNVIIDKRQSSGSIADCPHCPSALPVPVAIVRRACRLPGHRDCRICTRFDRDCPCPLPSRLPDFPCCPVGIADCPLSIEIARFPHCRLGLPIAEAAAIARLPIVDYRPNLAPARRDGQIRFSNGLSSSRICRTFARSGS